MLDLKEIDSDWTLFLDRDGVLNHEKKADYIRNWSEFHFYDGVLQALRLLNRRFAHILVVTNQKGVGKGWMSEEDLKEIHLNMLGQVEAFGGRIDRIYYCTDLDESSPNRKPNPGMGHQAKSDFPDIDFSHAIMVGNTEGDMKFGRQLGMYTVFIPSTRVVPASEAGIVDAVYPDLLSFAKALQK